MKLILQGVSCVITFTLYPWRILIHQFKMLIQAAALNKYKCITHLEDLMDFLCAL